MTDRVQTPSSNGAGADIDAVETSEWLEALDAVVEHDGPGPRAPDPRPASSSAPSSAGTGPIATPQHAVRQHDPGRRARPQFPGDPALERRLRSIVRWNAIAMVVRANKDSSELGGHIASYQSLATLYEVGFNHFWHAPSADARRRPRLLPGPLLAGHLRARVPRGPADRGAARQLPPGGRPAAASRSYPHPWLMPDFWQFPTVSLGLGADHVDLPGAVHALPRRRAASPTPSGRKVWAFLGDGEMDEPESLGAIGLAGARAARQPDLGRQLQPAAPRRPGPRQRQDHPGARGRLPRRRLERDQGDLGLALGSAARRRHRRPARAA